MENKKSWDIGEFASFKIEDTEDGFRIVIEGTKKYKWLIADKIEEIEITQDDLNNLSI